MFKRIKIKTIERNSGVAHPDYEVRNTRVSEYLRKYGTGKMENLPQDTRPEIHDERSEDEMIEAEISQVDNLGADELDILQELEANKERFAAMENEIELTKKQKAKFDNAMKVLNDPNSTDRQKLDAISVLDQLEAKGKVTRARD